MKRNKTGDFNDIDRIMIDVLKKHAFLKHAKNLNIERIRCVQTIGVTGFYL